MFRGPNDDPGKNVRFTTVDEDTKLLDEYDRRMLNYIDRLYMAVNGETMNIDNVRSAVDALQVFNQREGYNYLGNLLSPEFAKGCKIPSSIPVPSAAFQLHNTVTLSTNSSGNLGVFFNPCFLYNKDSVWKSRIQVGVSAEEELTDSYLTSFWYNNSETLTGSQEDSGWLPVNVGQGIPPVYANYRIVSASLVVKYIGRMDITSGVVGGAIIFDDSNTIGMGFKVKGEGYDANGVTLNPDIKKYGNFDLAMDAYYHQENLSLEGIREIYFPLDNSFEEYVGMFKASTMLSTDVTSTDRPTIAYTDRDNVKLGFNYFFYSVGAPANSSCFKFDIYVNYECLPDSNFLNYMPISSPAPSISSMDKSYFIKYVQQQPITKGNEVRKEGKTQTIWDKWKKKFGQIMPSVVSVAKKGLLSGLPLLKVGLSVANSLVNDGDVEMN